MCREWVLVLIFKFDSREHLCPKTSRAFLESEKATWRTEGLRPAKMAVILNKKLDRTPIQ